MESSKWMNNFILITRMQTVFQMGGKYYESFKNLSVYDFKNHHDNLTIEGGDILIFNKDIACIGISERTPIESISQISNLFYKEGISNHFFSKCESGYILFDIM